MHDIASVSDVRKAEAISLQLTHDVSSAIALNAMHGRAVFHEDISEKFNRTHEAWGLNEIIWSLNFTLILTLVRIYDQADRNTASLPSLFKLVAKPSFFEAFQLTTEQDRLNRKYDYDGPRDEVSMKLLHNHRTALAKSYAIERTDSARPLLKHSREIFELVIKGDIYERLRSLRNMAYAHNSIDMEKMKQPKNHYVSDLLEQTIPIVADVSNAMGIGVTSAKDKETWEKRADDFWIACTPQKSKRFRP